MPHCSASVLKAKCDCPDAKINSDQLDAAIAEFANALEFWVGRSRYAEKVHLTAPRIILHDHALAYEGVILHNFVEIRQHEHIIINTL